MKNFIDLVKIKVQAGRGGDGRVAFRREKYVPKGGPSGGDGGKGGNVYLKADKNLVTLYDFTQQPLFKAQSGESGGVKKMTGKSGQDLYLKVPVGTVIKVQGKVIADLTKDGETFLAAEGGKGGVGNVHFKSAVNQAPRQFTVGKPGEEKELVLELKMIAEIGIIGLPNAGKSTLLNALTAARAGIGAYPFTTLRPNLAVMTVRGQQTVLADIPGLIEGASKGKGLGDEFLRHIERTKVLLHIIDPLTGLGGQSVQTTSLVNQTLINYRIIRRELADYSRELLKKPELVVINKIDVTEIKKALPQIEKVLKGKLDNTCLNRRSTILAISAATGQNLENLRMVISCARGLNKRPTFPDGATKRNNG